MQVFQRRGGPAAGGWLAQMPSRSTTSLAFKVTRGVWTSPALRREPEPDICVMVGGMLDGHGIDAVLFDGEASIGEGSFFLIPVRVMVDEGDLAEARALLPG